MENGIEEDELPGDSGMSGMSGMSDRPDESRHVGAPALDLSSLSASRGKESARARGQESSRSRKSTGRRRENRYAHDSGRSTARAEATAPLPVFSSMEQFPRDDRLLRLQIVKDVSDVVEQRMRFHRGEVLKEFQGEFTWLKDICENIVRDIHAVRSQLTQVEQHEEQLMEEQEKNRLKLTDTLDAFKDRVMDNNSDLDDDLEFTTVLTHANNFGVHKRECAKQTSSHSIHASNTNGDAQGELDSIESLVPSLAHPYKAQCSHLEEEDEKEKEEKEEEPETAPSKSPFAEFVEGSLLNSISTAVIMTNTVHIAISTEVAMVCTRMEPGRGTGCSDSPVLAAMNYCFFVFYFLEALLKAAVQGSDYVYGEEKWWNCFDTLLVLSGVVDIVEDIMATPSGLGNLTWLRLLRLLKMMKMLRVVRVMRAFKDLRVILSSLVHAITITFWALVAMGAIMFFFSLCFLQGLSGYLGDTVPAEIAPAVLDTLDRRFSNLSRSMETLFLTVTGGMLWDELGACLLAAGILYYWLLVLFVGFSLFAMLNVINGICCGSACAAQEQDYESIVVELVEKNDFLLQQLRELLQNLDANGDGQVSLKELESLSEDARVVEFLSGLDITWEDSLRLFKLLQKSHQQQKVPVDVFIDSCVKLKGAAKSIDVICLLSVVGKMATEQRRQTHDVMECLASLRTDMAFIENSAKSRHSVKMRAAPACSNGTVSQV